MKRILYTIILLSTCFLTACDKNFLDRNPLDQLSDESFWKTQEDVRQYVNATYRHIAVADDHVMYDVFTDNGVPVHTFADQGKISFGTADSRTDWFKRTWKNTYSGIRRCNVFFQQIDNVEMSDKARAEMTAEIRFLRAYYYQFLMKLYGEVPLLTLPMKLDDPFPKRNSIEEILTFVLDELDEAAPNLPLEYENSKDVGRITRGAALSLKANVLLFSGKHEEAYEAAKKVTELDLYSLYDKGYGQLFLDENNPEVIFDIQYMKDQHTHYMDIYFYPASFGGYAAASPTQDFVDAFQCLDGKSIENSSSYDKLNPFLNRDPRLEASVLHHESEMNGKTLNTYSGIDALQAGGNSTKTGYFPRKYLNPDNPGGQIGDSWTNFILIRYAEILLTIAEAKNEILGAPDQEVYNMVNQVRARKGVEMPALSAGLTKEQMREAIRQERRVEFGFEGMRLFDIRRWKIGEQVMNRSVYGQRMPTPAGEHIFVEDRKFTKRDYLWAIPQYDIDLSKNVLSQNFGY